MTLTPKPDENSRTRNESHTSIQFMIIHAKPLKKVKGVTQLIYSQKARMNQQKKINVKKTHSQIKK